ncbi:MAG: HAD-IA family hydrolase [Polyangiales bacterium]
MTIRAVLFDRDGVLTYFDFAPLRSFLADVGLEFAAVREAWEGWYRGRALPSTQSAERAFIGEFLAGYCAERGAPESVRHRVESYDYATMVRPFADARPALERARAMALKTGVLSNFPLLRLEDSLRAASLFDLLDGAWAAAAIGASKPDPRSYRTAAAALDVDPEECAFVDDEEECVLGARAIGMFALRLDRNSTASDDGVVPNLTAFIDCVQRRRGAPESGA